MLSSHIHGKGGRARGFVATSLLLATCLIGMLALSASASAAPVNGSAPTISYMMSNENPNATGLQTLIPAVDAVGDAVIWNGTSWSAPEPIDPSGDSLTAVSCSSATSCVAADAQGDTVKWDGTSWS